MKILGHNDINKTTIINIVSVFFLKGLDFFMTPIFSKIMGPDNYGKYALFISWSMILVCFMGGNVQSSIATAIYDYQGEYKKYRSNIFFFGCLICLGICALGVVFVHKLGIITQFSKNMIICVFLYSFSFYIIEFMQNCFIYEKKVICNMLLSVFLATLSVSLSLIIMDNVVDNKYVGRILGTLCAYVLVAIGCFIYLCRDFKFDITKTDIRYSLLLGGPIIFHLLSHNVLNQSDRLMLQKFNFSDSEIGIYSIYYSYASIVKVVLTALNNSWCPYYYDDLNNNDFIGIKTKGKRYIEIFTVIVCVFLLFGREVGKIFADISFWSGLKFIPIIVLAIYYIFMYQLYVNIEFYYKKTFVIASCSICAAIVNIILNYFLIPVYGVWGAAFATAVSYFILFLVHYLYVYYRMKKQYLGIKIFIFPLMCVFICAVLYYCLCDYVYIRWGIGVLVLISEVYSIYKRKSLF